MENTLFDIQEHVIPCQHIREYPRGVKSEGSLRLALKQYTPITSKSENGITIIAGHGNGIPKECYEPLWEELLRSSNIPIKSIWIADCSHQGASGVMNEKVIGHDPNWFDHSRDLLCMINHFRDSITPPIFGICHSFSCSQFVHLSLMHPSLFQGLAFLEPMIQLQNPSKMSGLPQAAFASNRDDLWASRASAESSLRSSPFFRSWDARSVDKFLSYGLRSVPTAAYPISDDSPPASVTLTTTKAQEAWTYLRMNASPYLTDGKDDKEFFLGKDMSRVSEEGHLNNREYVTTCPSAALAFELLPYVRPSVLYVFGERSHINRPPRREDKLNITGTGTGGNGGLSQGRVECHVVQRSSHMMPLEKIHETASVLSQWLEKQLKDFEREQQFYKDYDGDKSVNDQTRLSAKWMQYMREPAGALRPTKSRL
ncbi:toxin biosynthesis protein [Periconia macrospinosa]|uniref:Toxin biosynthesis protein n=1 Tax=Periconia macrospinosa TaxID=97972 RepID=A0A2V1DHF2_9PLEO|nr:toxin biosynthesis protein [Periconia macrospinosa]